jgi:hypothetical protein
MTVLSHPGPSSMVTKCDVCSALSCSSLQHDCNFQYTLPKSRSPV